MNEVGLMASEVERYDDYEFTNQLYRTLNELCSGCPQNQVDLFFFLFLSLLTFFSLALYCHRIEDYGPSQ